MIIFPAIDIKGGKVVRLFQGKFDEVTEYSGDPLVVAQKWQQQGAQWLHVVDLDGARTGTMQNRDAIIEIAKKVPIPIQAGGGIRSREDIQRLIDGGVARVILGTRVISDHNFLIEALGLWKKKIAISLDCSQGVRGPARVDGKFKCQGRGFCEGFGGLEHRVFDLYGHRARRHVDWPRRLGIARIIEYDEDSHHCFGRCSEYRGFEKVDGFGI